MRDANRIFEFELDFAGTLRCIPMSVRYKLDECGVKLSLKQWNRFTREERAELLERDCESPQTVVAYRSYLLGLIAARANDKAELVGAAAADWSDGSSVPVRVVGWAQSIGVAPPSEDQWRKLSPLQRFVLFKLTRPGHKNENFLPAMREFGLVA